MRTIAAFTMACLLLLLSSGAVNQGEKRFSLAPPELIDNDLRGALYCDCYKQVRKPGRWTVGPDGYRRWIPAGVERHDIPCPGNVLFLHRRYIA